MQNVYVIYNVSIMPWQSVVDFLLVHFKWRCTFWDSYFPPRLTLSFWFTVDHFLYELPVFDLKMSPESWKLSKKNPVSVSMVLNYFTAMPRSPRIICVFGCGPHVKICCSREPSPEAKIWVKDVCSERTYSKICGTFSRFSKNVRFTSL